MVTLANALHAGREKSVLFVASNTNDSLGLLTCRTKVPQELDARINKVHGVPFLPPLFNGGWGGFVYERGFFNYEEEDDHINLSKHPCFV